MSVKISQINADSFSAHKTLMRKFKLTKKLLKCLKNHLLTNKFGCEVSINKSLVNDIIQDPFVPDEDLL